MVWWYPLINKTLLIFGVASFLALSVGCGEPEPSTGTISGQLRIGDEPLGNCKVSVSSPTVDFSSRAATVGDDGKFEILKVLPGEYMLLIAPIPEAEDPMDAPPNRKSKKQLFTMISNKYGQYKTSGITATVKADEVTELDVQLSK